MKKLLVLLSLLTGLAQAGDVVFHSIPVVPQSTISAVKKEMPVVLDGETVLAPMTINETNRCGYHALFNAARFISRFADAGSTSATHDLESKIADFTLMVSGKASDALKAPQPDGKSSVYNPVATLEKLFPKWSDDAGRKDKAYIGDLSDIEISRIVKTATSGALKDGAEAGSLAVFGSVSDFEHSADSLFDFDRVGRFMQALQAGQPVGICLCLDEEQVSVRAISDVDSSTGEIVTRKVRSFGGGAGCAHWVAIGLQKVGDTIHVLTMDSFGNHFNELLRTRIQAIVTRMATQNPIAMYIKAELGQPCDPIIKNIRSHGGETHISEDSEETIILGNINFAENAEAFRKLLVTNGLWKKVDFLTTQVPGNIGLMRTALEEIFSPLEGDFAARVVTLFNARQGGGAAAAAL